MNLSSQLLLPQSLSFFLSHLAPSSSSWRSTRGTTCTRSSGQRRGIASKNWPSALEGDFNHLGISRSVSNGLEPITMSGFWLLVHKFTIFITCPTFSFNLQPLQPHENLSPDIIVQ